MEEVGSTAAGCTLRIMRVVRGGRVRVVTADDAFWNIDGETSNGERQLPAFAFEPKKQCWYDNREARDEEFAQGEWACKDKLFGGSDRDIPADHQANPRT